MTNKQIQNLLSYLGYYTGAIDGIIGQASKSAIYDFQIQETCEMVDGTPGVETEAKLIEAVANNRFKKKKEDSVWERIKFFSRAEFECTCNHSYCNGFPAEPDQKLVLLCEDIRSHFGTPVYIESGVRCPKRNAEVGGVYNSRHMNGWAADLWVEGYTAKQVLSYVKKHKSVSYCYAITNKNVHIDVIP